MASVQSSRANKYARHSPLEDEAPDHVASAGELLIKELVQKQTDTNMTLEQHLKVEKKFERGVGFVSVGELLPGTSSLHEFEKMQLKAERIQELEGRGLTRAEAVVVTSGLKDSKASEAALKATQQYVQQQILSSQELPSKQCAGEGVSRRDLELGGSVKPDSMETKLYKFAMGNTSAFDSARVNWRHPDHPIHSLPQMEQALTRSADPITTARTVRRKRRQLVESMAKPSGAPYKTPVSQHTLWDCIEKPVIVPQQAPKPLKISTCKRETLYTIKENQIVQLDRTPVVKNEKEEEVKSSKASGHAFISLVTTSEAPEFCGRLTENEIKQYSRFKNYERGTISKILYIKNLSSSVTESDLAAVFDKFQEINEDKIIYRLMNGKMRGQAFITFKNSEIATHALEAVNGVILKGKPMIIQFGRHHT